MFYSYHDSNSLGLDVVIYFVSYFVDWTVSNGRFLPSVSYFLFIVYGGIHITSYDFYCTCKHSQPSIRWYGKTYPICSIYSNSPLFNRCYSSFIPSTDTSTVPLLGGPVSPDVRFRDSTLDGPFKLNLGPRVAGKLSHPSLRSLFLVSLPVPGLVNPGLPGNVFRPKWTLKPRLLTVLCTKFFQ